MLFYYIPKTPFGNNYRCIGTYFKCLRLSVCYILGQNEENEKVLI